MRNAMKYTQLFAGAVAVPAVGFGGSCTLAEEGAVLATCFGDEKTLSAALLV
jgi:hypothetical protein